MKSITVLDCENGEFIESFRTALSDVAGISKMYIGTDESNPGDIVVFSDSFNRQPAISHVQDRVYVVPENGGQPLIWLSKVKQPAICCGMDGSCSVSISSMYDSTCVVSVLRRLVSPWGRAIEPMDYPVTTEIIDRYAVMSAMTAAMLM